MDRQDPIFKNLLAYSEELNQRAEKKKLQDRVLLGTFAGPLLGAALVARTGQDIAKAVTLPTRAMKGEISPEALDLETGETGPNPRMTEEAMNAARALGGTGALVPKPANSVGIFGGKIGAMGYRQKMLDDYITETGRVPTPAEREALFAKAPLAVRPLGNNSSSALFKNLEAMEAAGKGNADILRETGWFRDPADNQWKFEIPDNQASLDLQKLHDGGMTVQRVQDVYDHPELYKYYPQAGKDTRVYYNPNSSGGSYNSDSHMIRIGNSPDIPEWEAMLHELQHRVQNIEGHQGGGSPLSLRLVWDEAFINTPKGLRKPSDLLYELSQKEKAIKTYGTTPHPKIAQKEASVKYLTDVRAQLESDLEKADPSMFPAIRARLKDLQTSIDMAEIELARIDNRPMGPNDAEMLTKLRRYDELYNQAKKHSKTDAFSRYENIPGERVARNTTTRTNMTPEERVTTPPWETLEPVRPMILDQSYAIDLETAMKNLLTKGGQP